MRSTLFAVTSLLAVAAPVPGQPVPPPCWLAASASQLAQRASPLDSITVDLGGAAVRVCYSRPSVRSRKIMGGLVPFGQPWRLGANEATTISVPFAAEIAGVQVQPGMYSLYVVPADSTWQIVVNRGANRWGIPIDAAVRAQDAGVGTVKVEKIDGKDVEMLTLAFGAPTGNATELTVEWEKTRVRIPVRRVAS